MSEQSSNKRIAKNTVMLYIRMLISMVVGLYTSRVVLQTLGVEDYGIYGVVGGVVSMMGFLNASMAGATSRFITFELGKGDMQRVRDTFSSALIVHMIIAVIIVVVGETAGLWFLCNKLVIPEERMAAAHWVYQFSIISAAIGVTQAPYSAVIMSHEKMDIYAYFELLNVALKLGIVYLLLIGNFDKLILYALLTLLVSLFMRFLYRIYCIHHYDESHFRWVWNKEILKPMMSFSGWNVYYETSFTLRQQGINFILNIFCGVIYNAASSLASMVQGIIYGFSTNIITAFKPQIIKTYAVGDYKSMNRLIGLGTKIAAILLLAVTIPILFKTEYLLFLWLSEIPEGAPFMVRCLLVVNIINTMSLLLVTGIQSTGKLTLYCSICGTFYWVTVLFMYICMLIGQGYKSIYVIVAATGFIVNVAYAIILKAQIPQFEFRNYYKKFVVPSFITGIIPCIPLYVLAPMVPDNIVIFTCYVAITIAMVLCLSYFLCFDKGERVSMLALVKSKYQEFIS